MPEDIHTSIWAGVAGLVDDEKFAVTTEIYEELSHLVGPIGECIRKNKDILQYELEDNRLGLECLHRSL
jgi:hypothetical protein